MTEIAVVEIPDEDVTYPPAGYDVAIGCIEEAIRNVSGTSITSSSAIVDVLLDIRNAVDAIQDEKKAIMGWYLDVATRLRFYEDMFGKISPPIAVEHEQ